MILNEIELLGVLSALTLSLLIISWLDEAVELNIYGEATDAQQFRVEPFGFWARQPPNFNDGMSTYVSAIHMNDSNGIDVDAQGEIPHLSPLLSSSGRDQRYSYESTRSTISNGASTKDETNITV